MAETLLTATDIYKSYADDNNESVLEVLQGVSLTIDKGTITSVVGSSGCGKSTLLHILGGLDKPDSGSVKWGDTEINTLKPDQLAAFRNKNIGFVFQFHHLLPEFTAIENIAMPALISGQNKTAAFDRALQLMDRFGVANRQNHRPTQLSGGEQQRVSMARALMNKPSLVLADEPTGNLDEANTDIILDLLFELRDKDDVAILLITHEKSIANRSNRVLEIKNGIIT